MAENPTLLKIYSVSTDIFPYYYNQDLYQRYYRAGISSYLSDLGIKVVFNRTANFPKALRLIGHIRESHKIDQTFGPKAKSIKSVADGIAWLFGSRKRPVSSTVGLYTFKYSTKELTACIDSADFGEIKSPKALDECDLYFKTNYNIEYNYGSKILPFYNCNPIIIDKINMLRSMRQMKPKYDFCFIVRVWGGKDEIEGIEHCMQLLEQVAKARGEKIVLAYLVAGDKLKLAERLRKIGVPSITKPMSLYKLWEISAQSRLNVIRLGMHQCIPWRLSELLALGACPVFDQNIKTVWPELLKEQNNYYSLNASTSADRMVSGEENYRAIPELLEDYLANDSQRREIGQRNAKYFDDNLDLPAIGRQICQLAAGRF